MAIATAQVSVGTTATALAAYEHAGRTGNSIAVQNVDSTNAVYLGASGVTTGTGYKLTAGSSIAFDLDDGETLYAIAASGTVTIHTLRTGL